MSNVSTLGTFGDVSGSPLMFRNKLINGGFDIWQRGTSQTSSGYGSDDRWSNSHNGSTKTASQQTFTLGQTDVPNNPRYWSRTVVTSSAGTGNYVLKNQAIESVFTLAGQTATLSFWAKADASKNIAVEFAQSFGTGGSPSSYNTGIGVTTCALTTSWKYFTVTVSIPSITGKTLGTNNDHFLQVLFWFDAGSTFNSRTNSLGQQSGTFDIAQVQLEAGSAATPFEVRPIGLELSLCQRYYQVLPVSTAGPVGVVESTTTSLHYWFFQVPFRSNTISCSSSGSFEVRRGGFASSAVSAITFETVAQSSTRFLVTSSSLTVGQCVALASTSSSIVYLSASAEL